MTSSKADREQQLASPLTEQQQRWELRRKWKAERGEDVTERPIDTSNYLTRDATTWGELTSMQPPPWALNEDRPRCGRILADCLELRSAEVAWLGEVAAGRIAVADITAAYATRILQIAEESRADQSAWFTRRGLDPNSRLAGTDLRRAWWRGLDHRRWYYLHEG